MNKNTSTEYVQIDTITGKMITASFTENSGFFRDEDIKKELIDLLVQEIIQERCIEFTKQIDPDSMSTFFRARIFVTPDTETRYIRQWMKK
jgi:hypothetical protein